MANILLFIMFFCTEPLGCFVLAETSCSLVLGEKHVVAFTATLSRSITLSKPKEVVKYDIVLTNVGHSYDPATGIFTAPYSGIYSISVSMMGKPNTAGHLSIVKNGHEMATLYSAGPVWDVASHTMNIVLKKQDTIWVRRSTADCLHGNERYNIFSAALIAEGNF